MVVIVGNKEGDDFLLFSFLILDKGKHQTAVRRIIIGFHILFAPINQRLFLDSAPGSHRKEYLVAYFIVARSYERA